MTSPSRDDARVAAGVGVHQEFTLPLDHITLRRLLTTIAAWAALLMRWAA